MASRTQRDQQETRHLKKEGPSEYHQTPNPKPLGTRTHSRPQTAHLPIQTHCHTPPYFLNLDPNPSPFFPPSYPTLSLTTHPRMTWPPKEARALTQRQEMVQKKSESTPRPNSMETETT